MTTSADVRAKLVTTLRRDLVGPLPDEADIATERLPERPSRWYLTGFIAPIEDAAPDEAAWDAEGDIEPEPPADPVMPGRADDDTEPDTGSAARRLMPNSLGLTVLLRPEVTEIEAVITWGDYVTEPPVEEFVLTDDQAKQSPNVEWRRIPREVRVRLSIEDGRSPKPIVVPDSAAPQVRGGGLALETHARIYTVEQPDGTRERVRALTVVLVNRRRPARRRYADVCFAFQARVALLCPSGFVPRCDFSGLSAQDEDRRLADLHYRDVTEYAVGRNTSAGWTRDTDGKICTTWTDPLPQAEVERVEPNTGIAGVEWGMIALASHAATGAAALDEVLRDLPALYEVWIAAQAGDIPGIGGIGRRVTAETLIGAMRTARDRIEAGIALLRDDPLVRRAFQAMNEAVARAAIQRDPGNPQPRWRPFQIAFILLNLSGLADKRHDDREVVDLLFFPTGGGKTEAYLGLAAWTIAHRRLTNSGKLGAGVAVLMRYTLRLLTLDQLARAAGVICALELMRGETEWLEGGKRLLGDWPIEVGLWIGSAASPNRLGGKGNNDLTTAMKRIDRFRKDGKEAPAPLKTCPWCGTPFDRESFACKPNASAPRNMEIRCANIECPFSGDHALPVLTVDEAIYRRLPAFLIATVDKFAGLPWLAESGAFFGHVTRADEWGFYGAADNPRDGTRLFNGTSLDPPDLIIQDELHLISGPLGTVAGLYETALDRLATRMFDGARVRPKIVASTATVRRAQEQIRALFDRHRTAIFPPPGPDRRDSFFAHTVPATEAPARLYVGLAAQGKGPKLVFLRVLTTLLAAAMKERQEAGEAVDPYMTALCYFNALRELGGARRIVEDEVNARMRSYGTQRRRRDPVDQPFADRAIGAPMELTSRVSTDQVAEAKQRLDQPCDGTGSGVDVALATNMISVGLDITRLGLMLVQGQPKTAAEYIQATSRVGRRADKPGLVLTVLNVHKPRDRMHYEQFRQFHACFYRAVEATSVTPWAARALDRALAAVLVAIARHIDPALTHETAVRALVDHPHVRDEVKRTIIDRAPVEVRADLADTIDGLLTDWMQVNNDQTANGARFYYAVGDQRLLHQPLEPALQRLSPEHQKFVAGRSMRDVESTVLLKARDPDFDMMRGG
jgi:hypothetical protein